MEQRVFHKEEERYRRLCAFIRENPITSVEEIEKATGVSWSVVFGYLKNGSMALGHGTSKTIQRLMTCNICKQEIASGMFCRTCEARGRNRPRTRFHTRTQARK